MQVDKYLFRLTHGLASMRKAMIDSCPTLICIPYCHREPLQAYLVQVAVLVSLFSV